MVSNAVNEELVSLRDENSALSGRALSAACSSVGAGPRTPCMSQSNSEISSWMELETSFPKFSSASLPREGSRPWVGPR